MAVILRPTYSNMSIQVFRTKDEAKIWLLKTIKTVWEDEGDDPPDGLKERVKNLKSLSDFEDLWEEFDLCQYLDYTTE